MKNAAELASDDVREPKIPLDTNEENDDVWSSLAVAMMCAGIAGARGAKNGDKTHPPSGANAAEDSHYLTKPFDMRELNVRVESLLKRRRETSSKKLNCGSLAMDSESFTASRNGEIIKLLPKEFALLEFFMRHPNDVFNAEALLRRVWASEADLSTDTVHSTLKRLRKKIDRPGAPSIIENVFAVGYKFVPPND